MREHEQQRNLIQEKSDIGTYYTMKVAVSNGGNALAMAWNESETKQCKLKQKEGHDKACGKL